MQIYEEAKTIIYKSQSPMDILDNCGSLNHLNIDRFIQAYRIFMNGRFKRR
jgi:hypothetical protein